MNNSILLESLKDERDKIQKILKSNSEYFKKQCQQYQKDRIGELSKLQQEWKESRSKWFSSYDNDGFITKYTQLKDFIKENEIQVSKKTNILAALKRISILHRMLTQFRNDFLMKSSSISSKDILSAIKKLEDELEQIERDYPCLNIVSIYKESIYRDIGRCKAVMSRYLDNVFKLGYDKLSFTKTIFIHQDWNIDMLNLIRKTDSESIFLSKVLDQWMDILRHILSYNVLYNCLLTTSESIDAELGMIRIVTIAMDISKDIKWSKESYLKLFHYIHDVFLVATIQNALLGDKELIAAFWTEYESELISLIQHLLVDDVLFSTPSVASYVLGCIEISESFSLLQKRIEDYCGFEHDHKHKDLKQYMMDTFSDPNFSIIQLPKMINHILINTNVSQLNPISPDDDYAEYDMSSFITILYQNETAKFLAEEFNSETIFEFGSQSVESDEITDFYMQFSSYKPRCSNQAIYIISLINEYCKITCLDNTKAIPSIKECFQIYRDYYQNINNTRKDVPHLSCLLYSDCYFLAHRLIVMIMPRFSDEESINTFIQEADQLICLGNESLDEQNQQQKKFIQECLYEGLAIEDLAGLHREDCRMRVDHQLKRIRHHLLNMKKMYGMTENQNILISRGAYVRSIGQCLNLVLQYVKDALISHITDITEEETHHFHALTISIASWTRELFHMDGCSGREIVYLKERIDDVGHVILELEEGMEDLLERQVSFLPDWISFQHMSSLFEWNMNDIVHYSVYSKGSILESYLLERYQVRRLIMAIFSPSDIRDECISILMNE